MYIIKTLVYEDPSPNTKGGSGLARGYYPTFDPPPFNDRTLLRLFMKGMVSAPLAVLLKLKLVGMVSFVSLRRIVSSLAITARERDYYCIISHIMSPYSMMLVTTPAPTVLPPSLIANLNCSSIATGEINSTSMFILSPGITISTPSGSFIEPVTSVVRK
jgi:hypothetical protein